MLGVQPQSPSPPCDIIAPGGRRLSSRRPSPIFPSPPAAGLSTVAVLLLAFYCLLGLQPVSVASAQGTRLVYADADVLPPIIYVNESVTDVDVTLEGHTANATWSPSVDIVVRIVDWQFIDPARRALRINITRWTRLRNVSIAVEGLPTDAVATTRTACSDFPTVRAVQVNVHDAPSPTPLNMTTGVAYMATLQVRHVPFCGVPSVAEAGLHVAFAAPDRWTVGLTNVEVGRGAVQLAPRSDATPPTGNVLVKIVPPLSLRQASTLQLSSLPDATVVLEEPTPSVATAITVESQSSWSIWNCTLRSSLASGATGFSNNLVQVSAATASKIGLTVRGQGTVVSIAANRCTNSAQGAGLMCGLNLRWAFVQLEAGAMLSIASNVLASSGVAFAGAALFSRWEALLAVEVAGEVSLSNQSTLRIASNALDSEYRCLRMVVKGRIRATNGSLFDVSSNIAQAASVAGAPASAQGSTVLHLAVWGATELSTASVWAVEDNHITTQCGTNTVTTWGHVMRVQLGPSASGGTVPCSVSTASRFTTGGNTVVLGSPIGGNARVVADSLLTVFALYASIDLLASSTGGGSSSSDPSAAFAVSSQDLTAQRGATVQSGGLVVQLASVATSSGGGGIVAVSNNVVAIDGFDASQGPQPSTPMALLYCRVAQALSVLATARVALENNTVSTNVLIFTGSTSRSPMYGVAMDIDGASTIVDGAGAELSVDSNHVAMSSASTVVVAVMLSLNHVGSGATAVVRRAGVVSISHNVVEVLNATGAVPPHGKRGVMGGVVLGTPRGGTLELTAASRLNIAKNTVAHFQASLPSNTPYNIRTHVSCGVCMMAAVSSPSSATSTVAVGNESRLSINKNTVALLATNVHAVGVLCLAESALTVASSSVVEVISHKLVVALTSTIFRGLHIAAGICTAPSPTGIASEQEDSLMHALHASALMKVTANTMDVSATSAVGQAVVEAYGISLFATLRITTTSRYVVAVNTVTLRTSETTTSSTTRSTALRLVATTSTAGVAGVWLQASSRLECTDNTVLLAGDNGTATTTSTAVAIAFTVAAKSTLVVGGAPAAVAVEAASMLSMSRNVLRKLRKQPNTAAAATAAKCGIEWTVANKGGIALAVWSGSLVAIEDNSFLMAATSGASTYVAGTFDGDAMTLSFASTFASALPDALLQTSGDALATAANMGAAGVAVSLSSTLGLRRNNVHRAQGTGVGIDCTVAFANSVTNPTCVSLVNNSALDISENVVVHVGGNALHVSALFTHSSYGGSLAVTSLTVAGGGSSMTVARNRWYSQLSGILMTAAAPEACYTERVCYDVPAPPEPPGGESRHLDALAMAEGPPSLSLKDAADAPAEPTPEVRMRQQRLWGTQGGEGGGGGDGSGGGLVKVCTTHEYCDTVAIAVLVALGATMSMQSNVIASTTEDAVTVASFADTWTFDGTAASWLVSSNHLSGATGALRWSISTTSFTSSAYGRMEGNQLAVTSANQGGNVAACFAMGKLRVAAAPAVLVVRWNKCAHGGGGSGSFATWANAVTNVRNGGVVVTCDAVNRRTLVDTAAYAVFVRLRSFGTVALQPTVLVANCTTFSTTRSPPSPTLSRPRRGAASLSALASESQSMRPPTRTPTGYEVPTFPPPTGSAAVSLSPSVATASPSSTRRRSVSTEVSRSLSVTPWTASGPHTPTASLSADSATEPASRSVSATTTVSATPTLVADSGTVVSTPSASASTSCDPFLALQHVSPLFRDFRVAPEAHVANDFHPSLPAEGVLPGTWGTAVDALVVEKFFLFELASGTQQRTLPVLLSRTASPYRVNVPLDELRDSQRLIGNGSVLLANGSAALFQVGQWSPNAPFNDGDTLEVRFVLQDALVASASPRLACDPTATFPLAYVRLGAPLSAIQQSVRDAMEATSIVTLVLQLLTGDGGGDLQTMILVGMMECTPKGGVLQNSLGNLKTLAPLLLEESFVGVIWGNVLLVGGVAVAQGVAMLGLWVVRRFSGAQPQPADGGEATDRRTDAPSATDVRPPPPLLHDADNNSPHRLNDWAASDQRDGVSQREFNASPQRADDLRCADNTALLDWWSPHAAPGDDALQQDPLAAPPAADGALDDVLGGLPDEGPHAAPGRGNNRASALPTTVHAACPADTDVHQQHPSTWSKKDNVGGETIETPSETTAEAKGEEPPVVHPIPIAVAFPGMVVSAAAYAYQGTLFAGVRLVQLYKPSATLTDDAVEGQQYRFAAGMAVVLCLLPLPAVVWRLSRAIHRSYHQFPMALGGTRDAYDLKYRVFTSVPAIEVTGVMLPSTIGRRWGPLVAACRPGGMWMAMPLASGWLMCVAALLQFTTSSAFCSAIVFCLAVANAALAVVVALYRPRRSRFLNVAAAMQLTVNSVTLVVNAASLQDPTMANQQLLAGLGFGQTVLSVTTAIGTLAVVLSTKFQRDRKGFLQLVWAIGPLCPEAANAEAGLEGRRRLVEKRRRKLRRIMKRLGYASSGGDVDSGASIEAAVRRAEKAYLKHLKKQQSLNGTAAIEDENESDNDEDNEDAFADAVAESLRERNASMATPTNTNDENIWSDLPSTSANNSSSVDILRSFALMRETSEGGSVDDPVLATLLFSPTAFTAATTTELSSDSIVEGGELRRSGDDPHLL